MRIVDPQTGKSHIEKRRVRYHEPGQPRELTFSCYRHHALLGRYNGYRPTAVGNRPSGRKPLADRRPEAMGTPG